MAKNPISTKNPYKNMFKGVNTSKKDGMHRPEGAGNFDNMDDYNIVHATKLREGTIEHTPVNNNDIANKAYVDSIGGSGGVTDHGALTGLSDDDHTQYLLTNGSRNVTGEQIFNDSINLTSGIPTIIFDDTHLDHDNYRIRINNDDLKIGGGSPNVDYIVIEANGTNKVSITNASLSITDMSSAGFVKNDVNGLLSGGNSIVIATDTDTIATGAELDTLTDNSMADTLHRHSELSASDGSPDPALSVDASGDVGIGTTSPTNLNGGAGAPLLEISGVGNPELVLSRTTSEDDARASFRINAGQDLVTAVQEASGSVIDAMTILSNNGNVGIGITPVQKLHIADTSTGTAVRLRLENSEGFNDIWTDGGFLKLGFGASGVIDIRGNQVIFSQNIRLQSNWLSGDGADEGISIDASGNAIISGGIDAGNNGTFLKTKVIEIGDWDMDATSSVSIAHGVTAANIRNIDVRIKLDSPATTTYGFVTGTDPSTSAGVIVSDTTNVILIRDLSGDFDNANFNATSFNRGWITITYEV